MGSTDAVIKTIELIQQVCERLKTTQSRQKSHADRQRTYLEFLVGDQVLLKVSPWKGLIRFQKRGKLGPRYNRPFQVIARVAKVSYYLDLPKELIQIHNTFHISQLRKCIMDEIAIVPLEYIHLGKRLNYMENPVAILDKKMKTLHDKVINLVKV